MPCSCQITPADKTGHASIPALVCWVSGYFRQFAILGLGIMLAQALGYAQTPAMEGEQVLDLLEEQLAHPPQPETVYTFLRRSVITTLKANGEPGKVVHKTHRAFTDGRDQVLLELDGQPASLADRKADRLHNLERQQRYLHRQGEEAAPAQSQLMQENMRRFRHKFRAEMEGLESCRERDTYALRLQPREEVILEHKGVNRLMDAMEARLWVDVQTHAPVRVSTRLVHPVSFLGGLLGLVRHIELSVDQQPIAPGLWVDEVITAEFDLRLLFKNIHFRIESRSEAFEPWVPHAEGANSTQQDGVEPK
jgi:hypothetical protein